MPLFQLFEAASSRHPWEMVFGRNLIVSKVMLIRRLCQELQKTTPQIHIWLFVESVIDKHTLNFCAFLVICSFYVITCSSGKLATVSF